MTNKYRLGKNSAKAQKAERLVTFFLLPKQDILNENESNYLQTIGRKSPLGQLD